MLILVLLLVVGALAVALHRHLRTKHDSRTLWRSSLAIGSSVGIARAVLACVGWYGVEHTGGPLQVPAFVLAMLAWPEAIVFGRQQGAAPLQSYVLLGLLLTTTSLLLVCGVALEVHVSRRHLPDFQAPHGPR